MCPVVSDFYCWYLSQEVIRCIIVQLFFFPYNCPWKFCTCSCSVILYPRRTLESPGEFFNALPKPHRQIVWFNYFGEVPKLWLLLKALQVVLMWDQVWESLISTSCSPPISCALFFSKSNSFTLFEPLALMAFLASLCHRPRFLFVPVCKVPWSHHSPQLHERHSYILLFSNPYRLIPQGSSFEHLLIAMLLMN